MLWRPGGGGREYSMDSVHIGQLLRAYYIIVFNNEWLNKIRNSSFIQTNQNYFDNFKIMLKH